MKIIVTNAPAGPAFIESPWNMYNKFVLEKLVKFELIPAWIENNPFSSKVPKEIRAAYSGNLLGNEEFFRQIILKAHSFGDQGVLSVHPCMFPFVLKEAQKLDISGNVELLSPVSRDACAEKAYSPQSLRLILSLFGKLYYKKLSKEEQTMLFKAEYRAEKGEPMEDMEERLLSLIDRIEQEELETRDIPPVSIFNKLRELLLLHKTKNPLRMAF